MNLSINPKDIPEMITRAELCRLLQMSEQTLERWILTGRIAKGKKVFFNRIFTKADVLKALRLPAQPATAGASRK